VPGRHRAEQQVADDAIRSLDEKGLTSLRKVRVAGESLLFFSYSALILLSIFLLVGLTLDPYEPGLGIIIVIGIVALPVIHFLIVVGEHIKSGKDKSTALYLWFILVLCLIGISGLVPLVVAFFTVIALSEWHKLNRDYKYSESLGKYRREPYSSKYKRLKYISLVSAYVVLTVLIFYAAATNL
jgi:hypothetical protein